MSGASWLWGNREWWRQWWRVRAVSEEGGFAQLQPMAVIWYDGPSILLLERLGFQKKLEIQIFFMSNFLKSWQLSKKKVNCCMLAKPNICYSGSAHGPSVWDPCYWNTNLMIIATAFWAERFSNLPRVSRVVIGERGLYPMSLTANLWS